MVFVDLNCHNKIHMIKATKATLILVFVFGITSISFGQEDWVSYVTRKNDAFMSITTDLQYDYAKPLLKNMVIMGTETKKCHKNGFPTEEGLQEIYAFSDSLAYALDGLTKNRLVGIITYKCAGMDVFYVKDTLNLRDNLEEVMSKKFGDRSNHLYINEDKRWKYYENIYPQNLEDGYFMDHEFLIQLLYEGDNLSKERDVKHWFYFNNLKRRAKFIKDIEKLDFAVDSVLYNKERNYPYELQISRKDSIAPETITTLTKMLYVLSNGYRGQYEGWGTEVSNKD
jgi:hypothetical protein